MENLKKALNILSSRLDGLKGSHLFNINGEHIETDFDQNFPIDAKIVAKSCSTVFNIGKSISENENYIGKLEHIIVAGNDYSYLISSIAPKIFTFVIAEDKIGDIHFHASRGQESEVGIKNHFEKWLDRYQYKETILKNDAINSTIKSTNKSVEEINIEKKNQVELFKKLVLSFLEKTCSIYILDKTSNTLYSLLTNTNDISKVEKELFALQYEIHNFIGKNSNNPLLSLNHITLWGRNLKGDEGVLVIYEVNNKFSLVIGSRTSLGEILYWIKHMFSDDINKLLNDESYSLASVYWDKEKINLLNEGIRKACSPTQCKLSMLINCEEKLPFGLPHTVAKFIDPYEIADIGTTIIEKASTIWDRLFLGELWKIIFIGTNYTISLAPIGKGKELGFISASGEEYNFLDEPVNQGIDNFRKAFNKIYAEHNIKISNGKIMSDFRDHIKDAVNGLSFGFYGVYDLKQDYKLSIRDKAIFISPEDIFHDFDSNFRFIEKSLVFNHYAFHQNDDDLKYIIIQSKYACLIYKLGVIGKQQYFTACILDKNVIGSWVNVSDGIDQKIIDYLIKKQESSLEKNIESFSKKEAPQKTNKQPLDELKEMIVNRLNKDNYKKINATRTSVLGPEFDLIMRRKKKWVFEEYVVFQIIKSDIDASSVREFVEKCDEAKIQLSLNKACLVTIGGEIKKEAYEIKKAIQPKVSYEILLQYPKEFE